MKMPQVPPDAEKILQEAIQQGRLGSLLRVSTHLDDTYWHWDELRYRTPPDGLTHEEWWAALKLPRNAAARTFPLLDKSRTPFRFSQPAAVLEMLHAIDRGFGMLLGGSATGVSRTSKDEYLYRSRINEAISSSQLEGAATTRQVAAEMLQTGRRPRDKSERMIANNFATLQQLSGWKDAPLSVALLLDIHRSVTAGTLDDEDAVGRFRRNDESIVVRDRATQEVLHVPPPAPELAGRAAALCAFANDTAKPFLHPVLHAVLLHFWLAYDHPFVDGNGRTARALFYWFLLRHDYGALEFVSISEIILRAPAQYARAYLFTETDDNDATYFLLHQLDVIQQAGSELHAYLARKEAEVRSTHEYLALDDAINPRQRALLAYALRHPGARYTVEMHRGYHNVAYETARKDLIALRERGWLVMNKVGNAFHFRAVSDLRERLQGAKP